MVQCKWIKELRPTEGGEHGGTKMKLDEMLKVFDGVVMVSLKDQYDKFLSYGTAQKIIEEGYTDVLPKEVIYIHYEQGRAAIVRIKY